MGAAEELNEKIVAQGNKVRDLKASKAEKIAIKAEVDVLLSLKAEFKQACGMDWKPGMTLPTAVEKENKAPSGGAIEYSGGGLTPEQAKDFENATTEALDMSIKNCGDLIRKLKQDKADKDTIQKEVKVLLLLKDLYKKKSGQDWKPPESSASGKESSKKEKKQEEKEKAEGYNTTLSLLSQHSILPFLYCLLF